jgi:putative membrane protein
MSRAALGALVVGFALWAAVTTWQSVRVMGAELQAALWTLAVIIPIHMLQIALSGAAWRCLVPGRPPSLAAFSRLRTVREGIDALLPVAHVGGEWVGAGLLAAQGVPAATARASVVADVTVELLTQVLFLMGGLAGLLLLSDIALSGLFGWTNGLVTAISAALAIITVQRFGGLRLLERTVRRLAARWPELATSIAAIEGALRALYRRPASLFQAVGLHLLSWVIGATETWVVMQALGQPISAAQALVLESLGMAARGAGFAIPGGWGAQEGGFILAAAALGLPSGPALSLSLMKRLREALLGLLGLTMWRWPASVSNRPI